ncbi:leucine-rich PPR motif-containing protein, mitochondrial [Musca vetustissima]|uniref:leucine-rich PPR motif-containing protein, mitochondrial n=1 Tax=Musca vetustissima TaxID=27455 RepID=UPI002AB7484B|nr:leucine-rich PPR motif-containing protein, mitochondrial [Musca vetustissima]
MASVMGRLDSFYQWNGFIGAEQLQPVLEQMKARGGQLSHEQGLFLLNICGCEMPSITPAERMAKFQEVWQYLQEADMITRDHYHIMLNVLQYNQHPLNDYKTLVQEYEKLGGSTKEIYSDLLAIAGATGNVKQTTELLAEMRTLQLPLSERDFNSLLLANARAKDMKGFETVKDSMHAAGLSLSLNTQSTLFVAFMENGDRDKALAILQDYRGQFEPDQVLSMLRSIHQSAIGSEDLVKQLVKELRPEYVKCVEVPLALRRVCVEFLHNNKLDYVMAIIDALPNPKFQENQSIDTYGVFLLHALFRANCEVEKIIEIATRLEESEKNSRALYIAAEIALRRSPPMVLPIFEELQKKGQTIKTHFFWPLMMYNFRRHNESGILRTLKIMQNFKVECDHDTICQYVLPRLSITLTNPQMALKQLEEAGIKTSLVMTPIVSHMLTQSKWFDVVPLVEAYPTKLQVSDLITPLVSVAVHVRATKRYHHFAKLINALANKNMERQQDVVGRFLIELLSSQARVRSDLNCVQRLLNELNKCNVKISATAVATITSLLNQTTNLEGNSNSMQNITQSLKDMTKRSLSLHNSSSGDEDPMTSSFIKHPRDMNLDELECHLVELEAKQMNTRGVLRRLLQLCVRENRLERALEIKQKCDKLQVQTSPGMLASIFDMYTKLKDLPNAQKYLKTIRETYPGFQIDEHKFVDYAALLVSCGQLDAAKDLLEDRSLKHRIVGGDYILKNVWNFLTNVAQYAATQSDLSPDRNLTRETYAFLQKLGYCRTHNAILGPIVRERLLRNDLPGALREFKQLATQYKHTPLQFELLSLIVRLCNSSEEERQKFNCTTEQAQQYLSEITEIITKIHGNVNMNSGLLLAFAESGSDNQLRRLLLTPEFRVNEDLLLRNCEHLGKEGAVKTLLRLARGARGLNRVIDEQNIYNMLLNNFTKANDYQAALNLYERLEADDEMKISQDFLRNLVNLLKANNVEIPSNVALRARIV